MIGWVITAAVLSLLLFMKVGVWLHWESGTAVLKLRIGLLRFNLSTDNKKPAKIKQSTDKKDVAKAEKPAGKAPMLKKWLRALVYHWREVLHFVARILRSPKLELLRLHVAVGGMDPEICAMRYGKICAGLSAAMPVVQSLFAIKKQDMDVSCCFEKKNTELLAETELTVRVYEVLCLLFGGLVLLIRLYRHTKTLEKAVQPQ